MVREVRFGKNRVVFREKKPSEIVSFFTFFRLRKKSPNFSK